MRAPFDGKVVKVNVDLGAGVAVGMPLIHLLDDSAIYVEAPFDEANASDIQEGMLARVTVDTYRDREFEGTVEHIPSLVSLNMDLSRTLNVKVLISDDTKGLLTGMSADVVLLVDKQEDVLYVPSEALVRQQYAYVIEDGVAVRRDIERGAGNWQTTAILSGLIEGETYITSVGLRELEDGVRVRVVEELEE